MGLFTNKKKLCPICGGATPRLLASKVEGQPLCRACAGKAQEMQGGDSGLDSMTIDTFREFTVFYDENETLRRSFQESFRYDFGFLGGSVSLDVPHGLMRFHAADSAMVFEASNLRSFCISEDENPLFEGTKDALLCYQSMIPDQVRNLESDIDRFKLERRQYEQLERMDKMLEREAKQRGESYSTHYYSAPDADRLKPFLKFRLKIELEHPYWSRRDFDQNAPGFDPSDPSIKVYLSEYEKKVEKLRELADQLMALLNPDAPRRQVSAHAVSGTDTSPGISDTPADAVAEIQKYKGLLDSGAITEEEFAAKKRQLLGI